MSTAPTTGNRAIKYMRQLRAKGYTKRNIGWCARRVREAFGFTYGVGATALSPTPSWIQRPGMALRATITPRRWRWSSGMS